jgi:hypothetical protein
LRARVFWIFRFRKSLALFTIKAKCLIYAELWAECDTRFYHTFIAWDGVERCASWPMNGSKGHLPIGQRKERGALNFVA